MCPGPTNSLRYSLARLEKEEGVESRVSSGWVSVECRDAFASDMALYSFSVSVFGGEKANASKA